MPHFGHSRLSPGVHQWPSWLGAAGCLRVSSSTPAFRLNPNNLEILKHPLKSLKHFLHLSPIAPICSAPLLRCVRSGHGVQHLAGSPAADVGAAPPCAVLRAGLEVPLRPWKSLEVLGSSLKMDGSWQLHHLWVFLSRSCIFKHQTSQNKINSLKSQFLKGSFPSTTNGKPSCVLPVIFTRLASEVRIGPERSGLSQRSTTKTSVSCSWSDESHHSHQLLHHPKQHILHPSEWPQKLRPTHGSGRHVEVQLELPGCLRHSTDLPRLQRARQPGELRRPGPWRTAAAHLSADLPRYCCHHHYWDRPRSPPAKSSMGQHGPTNIKGPAITPRAKDMNQASSDPILLHVTPKNDNKWKLIKFDLRNYSKDRPKTLQNTFKGKTEKQSHLPESQQRQALCP